MLIVFVASARLQTNNKSEALQIDTDPVSGSGTGGRRQRHWSAAATMYGPDAEGEFYFEISRLAPRTKGKPQHRGSAFIRASGLLHL
ncbi:hypothetical protein, partial [Mesorhizobium sp.]|uniref:hypothetical protein n=1 Tax=Mesorhizobium sp. TaxID=1871066 RepID=UPI0025BB3F39